MSVENIETTNNNPQPGQGDNPQVETSTPGSQQTTSQTFEQSFKFGGIEVKSMEDLAKAQQAFVNMQQRATSAEQRLAQSAKPAQASTETTKSFLDSWEEQAQVSTKLDRYIEAQIEAYKAQGQANAKAVEAFSNDVKGLVKNLYQSKGEDALKSLDIKTAFDVALNSAYQAGNTVENSERWNKANTIMQFNAKATTLEDLNETFEHYAKAQAKPHVAGAVVNTQGFDNVAGQQAGGYQDKVNALRADLKSGKITAKQFNSQTAALQKQFIKFQ